MIRIKKKFTLRENDLHFLSHPVRSNNQKHRTHTDNQKIMSCLQSKLLLRIQFAI